MNISLICILFDSLMQAACDVAFEYVHVRKQFGKPVGQFQLMQVSVCKLHQIVIVKSSSLLL